MMKAEIRPGLVACDTLVQLLRRRAVHQPALRGYVFLADGEVEKGHLTYAALDRQARTIAAMIQKSGGAGERALLVYPPGLEYIAAFFGCLYAGVVAVPVYPPQTTRADRALARFRAITQDAQPSLALTTSPTLAARDRLFALAPELKSLRWLATDQLSENPAPEFREAAIGSNSLAFLQYTSGSTAAPKGVMLTHGNLLHNSFLIHRCFEHSPESRGVIWLPPYHDMGLIGGILQPLYGGFPVVLMSPLSFLYRPLRWLQAISRYRATTSGGPNFAYDLCVRRITPEQRATLDLSSWDLAFNGSEPVQEETLERFAALFEPCGFRREAFYPCYGLAEATLIVSGGRKAAAPVAQQVQTAEMQQNRVAAASDERRGVRTLVGCGQTLPDEQIAIVDPEICTRCAPGQVGEIWVSGPSVAQGYWNRPEEMEQTFRAYLADTGEGPFLRTGDLGFFQDGELFITGRIKDLIIIAGRNHYPQDIEQTAEKSHPVLRPGGCAAFSVDGAGVEQLVVLAEVERHQKELDLDEVLLAIRRAVAEHHEVMPAAVLLLKAGAIPKTSSGKTQRHVCRAAFLSQTLDVMTGSGQA